MYSQQITKTLKNDEDSHRKTYKPKKHTVKQKQVERTSLLQLRSLLQLPPKHEPHLRWALRVGKDLLHVLRIFELNLRFKNEDKSRKPERYFLEKLE